MPNLEIKVPAHVVPSYSLTGDLLSFLRCSLQYRYYNGSALPPSRPVQLWYGEFIHGVLEAAYRIWSQRRQELPFPWPCTVSEWGEDPPAREEHDIGYLGDRIEVVLRAQAKEARSQATRNAAYRRANAAVNELGPLLFPLIADAETKVIGTRLIPKDDKHSGRADRYELHGVIDVVTQLELAAVAADNPLRIAIEAQCGRLPAHFEVIADYKGSPRPEIADSIESYWKQGDWQVQTYAWLRGHQSQGVPIVAGVLFYINELAPGADDMREIRRQVIEGTTDVLPVPGSDDDLIIRHWKPGQSVDQLSFGFRLRRCMRVIPVTPKSLDAATRAFDAVVHDIEGSIENEAHRGTIAGTWSANCKDEQTCAACDFRHFCPTPAPDNKPVKLKAPSAP